ncbi:XRE family transcriptional regulator [Peptostreptococcus canis]|uniref:Helix-turn-helix domain-containing protein n=1 Tax=Peptostreptococcus canis TaxID=1159213 RepID=A0ABR6TKS9_9FIRM|nr:XRE family transcriptional regulator [Peptostreptococcus canis]MBC2576021.1 helix-turn-helix domain-containing protein [Peptostreptococcus canis]MBP1997855.1 transcriptional regulator with XRE-family HTH domain [Peptostreptococcus canis]
MNIDQIGARLTNYRKNSNMTIKDFSQLSGVSTALLSQLERGMGNPSLSVLCAIAKTMNISVSSLFEETIILNNLVKRADEQPNIMDTTKENIEFQLLTTKSANLSDDLFRITIHSHSETEFCPFGANELEEIMLVEKGPVTIVSDNGDSIILKKGDTMRLVSKLRYKIKNNSSHEVTFLFIASNSNEVL